MHDDEIDRLRELTPGRVLRARYVLAQRLESPGSTSGLVAERARQGLATRPADGYQGDGAATTRAELAYLLGLMRDLSAAEERACAIRYGSVGEQVGYETARMVGNLREGDGEEITSLRPKDMDGKPLGEGWVTVRGVRERRPSYAEVAQAMAAQGWRNGDDQPMTSGAVEKLLRTASEKVATAIRARLMMAMLEAGACG